jgi:high-affinity iron transporter
VSRDAIAAALQKVVDVAHSESTWWSALWQSFLIIMREGFEAILVVGAVVAFLIKTGNRDRLRHIWWGVVAGGVASIATAAVLATALSAVQTSREVLEGVTMLFAVAVLFSVSYWLISKVEAVKWQRFLKEKVSRALDQGGGRALVFVAFLAVYREGAETALFYQVLFNDGPRVVIPIVLGLVTGGAALAVVFTLFYRYGVRIPLRPFFAITGGLLYYLAFAFTGKGLRELQEGQVIAITSVPHVPQIELLGVYPTLETLLGQAVLLALLVFALLKTFAKRRG